MNPIILFKILPNQYARSLLSKGTVHFSRPRDWAALGADGDCVRGDPLEGCYAATEKYNESVALLRDNSTTFSYKGLVRYRDTSVENLAAFCAYGIHLDDFSQEYVDGIGDKGAYLTISHEYFSSFNSNLDQDAFNALPEHERPAAVIIFDMMEFSCRLARAASSLFDNKARFIGADIKYADLAKPYYNQYIPPTELFYKDLVYEYQHEYRYIIESTEETLTCFFEDYNGNIDIGPIDDIASIEEGYYFKDINLMLKDGELLYPLSVPRVKKLGMLHDASLEEVISMYVACSDYVARYHDGNNEEPIPILEEEIKRRTGANDIYFDPYRRKMYINGVHHDGQY